MSIPANSFSFHYTGILRSIQTSTTCSGVRLSHGMLTNLLDSFFHRIRKSDVLLDVTQDPALDERLDLFDFSTRSVHILPG